MPPKFKAEGKAPVAQGAGASPMLTVEAVAGAPAEALPQPSMKEMRTNLAKSEATLARARRGYWFEGSAFPGHMPTE